MHTSSELCTLHGGRNTSQTEANDKQILWCVGTTSPAAVVACSRDRAAIGALDETPAGRV